MARASGCIVCVCAMQSISPSGHLMLPATAKSVGRARRQECKTHFAAARLPSYRLNGEFVAPPFRNSWHAAPLTPPTFSPADRQRVTELAHQGGQIAVPHPGGDQGPGLGVSLHQREAVALAAVRGLLAGTLEAASPQQARV